MSVKRNELFHHLAQHNCFLYRHGSKHDIYQNDKNLTTYNLQPVTTYSQPRPLAYLTAGSTQG